MCTSVISESYFLTSMPDTVEFYKDVSLLPQHYDQHIEDHLLQLLKKDFEGRIHNGYLIIKVLHLLNTLDIFTRHVLMNGILHVHVRFSCLTETLHVGELIKMTKLEMNAAGSFWQTENGFLKCFTMGTDPAQPGDTKAIEIVAKSDNGFTIGVIF